MTITSLDGYRWLKNDIIRGNFQPDEKLRMSLLTSRYALGGNDSNLLIVFYVQIMPDDLVMQLHRF